MLAPLQPLPLLLPPSVECCQGPLRPTQTSAPANPALLQRRLRALGSSDGAGPDAAKVRPGSCLRCVAPRRACPAVPPSCHPFCCCPHSLSHARFPPSLTHPAQVTLGGEKRAAREEAITLPLNGDMALLVGACWALGAAAGRCCWALLLLLGRSSLWRRGLVASPCLHPHAATSPDAPPWQGLGDLFPVFPGGGPALSQGPATSGRSERVRVCVGGG